MSENKRRAHVSEKLRDWILTGRELMEEHDVYQLVVSERVVSLQGHGFWSGGELWREHLSIESRFQVRVVVAPEVGRVEFSGHVPRQDDQGAS